MSVESPDNLAQADNSDKLVAHQYLVLQTKSIELQEKKIDYRLKKLTHDAEYDKEQLRSDHEIALGDLRINHDKVRTNHEFRIMVVKYAAAVIVLSIICALAGFIILIWFAPNDKSKIIESLFGSIEGAVKLVLAALAGAGGYKLFKKDKPNINVDKTEDIEEIN